MHFILLWILLLVGSLQANAQSGQPFPDVPLEDQHIREELGVNVYTTPSIGRLFKDLETFRPIPVDDLYREPNDRNYSSRIQIALDFGSLIANGFLVVEGKKKGEVEKLGRVLLKRAQGLGIGGSMTRHSKSLMDHGKAGNWEELKAELISAQQDVEQAMMELRDEEIAHMISLGGWLRGLEIAATAASESYSDEKTEKLSKLDLVDYYIDRVQTLSPSAKKAHFVPKLTTTLQEIRSILDRPAAQKLTKNDIRKIRDKTKELNKIIAQQDDPG